MLAGHSEQVTLQPPTVNVRGIVTCPDLQDTFSIKLASRLGERSRAFARHFACCRCVTTSRSLGDLFVGRALGPAPRAPCCLGLHVGGTQPRAYRAYAFTLTLCDGDSPISPPIVIKHSFSQGGTVGNKTLATHHARVLRLITYVSNLNLRGFGVFRLLVSCAGCSRSRIPPALLRGSIEGPVYFLCPLSGDRIVLARPVESAHESRRCLSRGGCDPPRPQMTERGRPGEPRGCGGGAVPRCFVYCPSLSIARRRCHGGIECTVQVKALNIRHCGVC